MFVDYSGLNKFSDINSIFADKYLELLFLEGLKNVEDKLIYLKGRNTTTISIQELTSQAVAQNPEWLKYIFGLCLSREQMEECAGVLLECPTLYMVEFGIDNCSIKMANCLDHTDPVRKAVLDVHARYVSIRAKINSHVKAQILELKPRNDKAFEDYSNLQKLLYGEYTNFVDEKLKPRTDVIIIPRSFPKSFSNFMQKDGFLSSQIHVRFFKWGIPGSENNLSLVTLNNLIPIFMKNNLTTIWKTGLPEEYIEANPRVFNASEYRTPSDTSVVLKDIQKRLSERQEKIRSLRESVRSESQVLRSHPDFMKVFDEIDTEVEEGLEKDKLIVNKTQDVRNRIKKGLDVNPGELLHFKDPIGGVLMERNQNLYPCNSLGLNSRRTTALQKDGVRSKVSAPCYENKRQTENEKPVEDLSDVYETLAPLKVPYRNISGLVSNSNTVRDIRVGIPIDYHDTESLEVELKERGQQNLFQNQEPDISNYPHSAFLPRNHNFETPDLVLKLPNEPKSTTLSIRIKNFVTSPFAKRTRSTLGDFKRSDSDLEDHPTWSKISFKNLIKMKYKKLKQDWKYYSDVAKFCIDDFKENSESL